MTHYWILIVYEILKSNINFVVINCHLNRSTGSKHISFLL